ncbi:hypothetical protein [Tahibacter amnicola]|uniref:DUF4174 domain-containing protein n=1 Tax=Tahibacter amnicola TaxID=2976241 RepID=A0ABY6BEI4_9GAMM|nr:hypothetical protein [Tahibacter amnicola]UXI68192.1 hypothetical protein N4264_00630 [Tahibacter amnicola]
MPSRTFITALLLASSAFLPAAARVPVGQVIDPVTLADRAVNESSGDIRPKDRWILVVLDANDPDLMPFADSLREAGYEGRNAIVLVVGDAASATVVAGQKTLLPQARWITGRSAKVLEGLDLPGTPAIIGLEAGSKVAWQELGLRKQPGDVAVRMSDWLSHRTAARRQAP